ncbi:MAG: hypothetical protein V4510_08295 [bacterium]
MSSRLVVDHGLPDPGVWHVSDGNVSAMVSTAYAFPARPADIGFDWTPASPVPRMAATWRTPAGMQSSMSADDPELNPKPSHDIIRVVWIAGTNVTLLDLREESTFGLQPYVVTGTMNPPMLYSRLGQTAYEGRGLVQPSYRLTGTFHRFSDLECKHPIAP